jgi:hypothetical protein
VVLAAVAVPAPGRAARADLFFLAFSKFDSDDAGLCARVVVLADAFYGAAGYQYGWRVSLLHRWLSRVPLHLPELYASVRAPSRRWL